MTSGVDFGLDSKRGLLNGKFVERAFQSGFCHSPAGMNVETRTVPFAGSVPGSRGSPDVGGSAFFGVAELSMVGRGAGDATSGSGVGAFAFLPRDARVRLFSETVPSTVGVFDSGTGVVAGSVGLGVGGLDCGRTGSGSPP